jgi:DNA-binding CsgD family transcriptional regulator
MDRRTREIKPGKRARSQTTRDITGKALPLYWPTSGDLFVAVYDWHVRDDRVRGDAGLAQLFSIEPQDVSEGRPIADFLKAIHPEDVKAVETSIAEACEKRDGFSTSYRLRDGEDWKPVNALGRCYQTDAGDLRFLGVVLASRTNQRPVQSPVHLPPRELQCLAWCSQGKTNWEIGRILGISERTAEHHIGSAVRRLGCTSRVQAVALALRLGLIK